MNHNAKMTAEEFETLIAAKKELKQAALDMDLTERAAMWQRDIDGLVAAYRF